MEEDLDFLVRIINDYVPFFFFFNSEVSQTVHSIEGVMLEAAVTFLLIC